MTLPTRGLPARSPRVALVSTFVPRECGLATFTDDVATAVGGHGIACRVVALERAGQGFTYDRRVVGTIQEDRLADYTAAADLIHNSGVDIVSVQHEFGIFGGEECDHLSTLLSRLHLPVVTTFHTLLRHPSPAMRRNLRQVAHASSAIVVMNRLAIEILESVYGVPAEKVVVIHHGAPEVSRARLYTSKRALGLHGRRVISTFGLLSSGKGLEYAVQAMPHIVARHPEALYLILGQTHPVVKQEEGERYRASLQTLAARLGIAQHVRFVDKYFTKAELIAYLLATDIYLTPYLNMDQVTSGTLAYAMACGRPLVSTPYLYAQFLLAEDRGVLVPPRDPVGIAEACETLFSHPDRFARMERANIQYGRQMMWSRVGQEYQRLFTRLIASHTPSTPILGASA